jgi:acyl-CoA reductase-like NAD-dependent aldehyde dehydrogenase
MFRLEFETANAAFTDDPAAETARILRKWADMIEDRGQAFYSGPVRDVNGNRIGKVDFDPLSEG